MADNQIEKQKVQELTEEQLEEIRGNREVLQEQHEAWATCIIPKDVRWMILVLIWTFSR